MRNNTPERSALNRKTRPLRLAFVREYGFCWACFSTREPDCHEMAKGCHKPEAIKFRCTWFVACWNCNMFALNDYSIWPIARQLAVKWIYDREHFDLVKFNELRGRAPGAITMADIQPWIDKERERCG